jgi:hypothetical protein
MDRMKCMYSLLFLEERMEMKKRHQAEEIVRILRDIEAGGNVAQGVRRHHISEQTLIIDDSGRLAQKNGNAGRAGEGCQASGGGQAV